MTTASASNQITTTYTQPVGAWVAYTYSGNVVGIFATEVEALRYALAHSSSEVKFVEWGEEVNTNT